jgi:hypothetical protein
MDATDLVDAIREANRTELSRLGSSKSLYADTEGEMEADVVLSAAADMAHHAAGTLEGWAEDDVGGVFAAAADRERDHHDAVVAELDEYEPGEPPAVVEYLRGQEGEARRIGALVGWSLVVAEKASQSSGFFTGQAAPGTASLFREFGDDYEATRSEALDALSGSGEVEAARDAGSGAVTAAYEAYVGTLEELGINPKPVC